MLAHEMQHVLERHVMTAVLSSGLMTGLYTLVLSSGGSMMGGWLAQSRAAQLAEPFKF